MQANSSSHSSLPCVSLPNNPSLHQHCHQKVYSNPSIPTHRPPHNAHYSHKAGSVQSFARSQLGSSSTIPVKTNSSSDPLLREEADLYFKEGLKRFSEGRFHDVLQLYKKALAIKKSILGEVHPEIALIQNNIGTTFERLGKYHEAISHYTKALETYQTVYGKDDLNVATCYSNIGALFSHDGQYKKALKCYTKTLEIRLNKLEENNSTLR